MSRIHQSLGIAAVALALQVSAIAKCPISDGATVWVRAPIGNLQVDTNGRDTADVEVLSKDIVVKEVLCSRDRVEYTAQASGQMRGTIDWKITVPRGVNLDLITFGGGITMGDLDGSAVLRTTGGSVTVGHIKGKTTIVTQGGFIKAGDIGDSVELRSSGAGSLEVGNIAGDAELHTAGGPITTGSINGKVTAETGGGKIYIKGARSEVVVKTEAGEIYIGSAGRIYAKTAGGNITNLKVSGSFQAQTASGDIRVESAGGWVEASTGHGTIFVKLVPENLDGDNHMDLQAAGGDITIYIPERIKANIDATVERPALNAQQIFSDFPMNALTTMNTPAPTGRVQKALSTTVPISPPINRFLSVIREETTLNGGGNSIKVRTSLGKIEILKSKK